MTQRKYGEKKEILLTAAIFLQKLATAAADVLWLVVLAELIEETAVKGSGTGKVQKAVWYILCLILLSAWKRMGYNLGRTLTLKLQNRIRFRQTCLMVEKTARIPYRMLEDHTFSQLEHALRNTVQGPFVWHMIQQCGNFCLYCIKTLGLCLLLAWADPLFGALFLLLQVCHVFLTILENEQEDTGGRKASARRQYLEALALGHDSVGERSLFSYIDFLGQKCDREDAVSRKQTLAMSLAGIKMTLSNGVLTAMGYVLTEAGLAALLLGGRIHFGYFTALSIGAYRCLNQTFDEEYVLNRLREIKLFLRQWNRFLHLPETEQDVEKSEQSCLQQKEFETLEFRNVSFRYPRTGRYVLRNLSFKLEKGGYYAFVGSNGSGKTTIVKLPSGLYDNYEGEIFINGIELRKITSEARRGIFAVLFQDAARYQDTILGNICPEENEPGEADRSIRAEKAFGEWLTAEENRFPQGINTFLGRVEDGVMLSEGEWQRLLLCRLFARPGQIRVMDEPLASLDIFWQGKVYERITQGDEGETILLFSHRMAAVRKAERIFVLWEGAIAEEGTHEQLLEKKGMYADMYEAQSHSYCSLRSQ